MSTTKANLLWFNAAGSISTRNVFIKGIYWVGTQQTDRDIGQNDDLVITDTSGGTTIFEKRATADNETWKMEFGGPRGAQFPPCYLEALDGGELLIVLG